MRQRLVFRGLHPMTFVAHARRCAGLRAENWSRSSCSSGTRPCKPPNGTSGRNRTWCMRRMTGSNCECKFLKHRSTVRAPGGHLSPSTLQPECIPQLGGAVSRASMDLRPKETQHLPALCLKLVGLPGVMNALADGRTEFQAGGVDQDSLRRDVGEVGARQ